MGLRPTLFSRRISWIRARYFKVNRPAFAGCLASAAHDKRIWARLRRNMRTIQHYSTCATAREAFHITRRYWRTATVMRLSILAIVLAVLSVASVHAVAQEFNIVIRDHKFEPQEIRVPAGKRVSIHITN